MRTTEWMCFHVWYQNQQECMLYDQINFDRILTVAYCSVSENSVASLGINTVRSHMLSDCHKAAMGHRKQVSITHFCSTPPSLPFTTEATTMAAASSSTADYRVMMGTSPLLHAEVRWYLNTASKTNPSTLMKGFQIFFKQCLEFKNSQNVHLWKR